MKWHLHKWKYIGIDKLKDIYPYGEIHYEVDIWICLWCGKKRIKKRGNTI